MEPGEKVAIIGQNGSGKSTIINLLLRFYTPCSGEITADGVPISQLALDEYRSLFSVVSQEPYLFFGDIVENVNLTGQAPSEKVTAALHTSGVADYAERMPEGNNTKIGRNGAKLSGGEKQKLVVGSDAYLHDVIVNQMEGKSVIMITHRYENLEGMDRVYQLKGGRIAEGY